MGNPSVDTFVDISSGTISQPSGNQWLEAGQEFAWTTNVQKNGITVTPQNMSGPNTPWFTAYNGGGLSFNGPASGQLSDNSNVAVVADDVSPIAGWSYTADIPVNAGHVVVKDGGEGVQEEVA